MMPTKQHHYTVRTVWSGATAGATRDYRSFSREHTIEVEGKALLKASADPSFRGDAGLHNPEDMAKTQDGDVPVDVEKLR